MEPIRCVAVGLAVEGCRGGVRFSQVPSLAAAEGVAVVKEADAVVVDLDATPLEEVSRLVVGYPHMPVVGVGSPERVLQAVRCGVVGVCSSGEDLEALAGEVRRAVSWYGRLREAARREVLRPLMRLRELVPQDASPETVLCRLAEIARVSVGADRAAAVTLSPETPNLAVALAELRGGQASEGFWTVVPDRLAEAPSGAEVEESHVATVALGTADRALGALTVTRAAAREPFSPLERELLDVLGVVGSLPLVQVDLLRRLQEGNQRLIDALAYACELHEASLRGHGERLASYALAIGRKLGLDRQSLEDLRVAGMLHDVGKIGISDTILLKPGPLTPEEYETVKRHTVMGAEILSAAGFGENVVRWVLHHHERWDGGGYPMGLAGTDIPLGARVLAVADAFEVMTTGRVYRNPLLPGQALEELRREQGRQFDPEAVAAFAEALSSREVGWETATFEGAQRWR